MVPMHRFQVMVKSFIVCFLRFPLGENYPMKRRSIFRNLTIMALVFGLVTLSIPSLVHGMVFVSPSIANQKFSIRITPSPLGIQSGADASASIVVNSVNSFVGIVNLTASISPSGPIISMDPQAVSVAPLIPGTSTLDVATGSAPAGIYTVKVTGTSLLARSSSASLEVDVVTLTSTTLSCSSPVAVGQPSLCAVVVTDSSPSATIVPSGTVNVASNGAGSFTAASCRLVGSITSASCSVSFVPSAVETVTIDSEYLGDVTHSTSSGSTSIQATPRTTTTTITCSSPVVIGQASDCIATVRDNSGATGTAPTGTVSFTTNSSFLQSSCALTAGTGTTSTCSVQFTPSSTGTVAVTGKYGSDLIHAESSGAGTFATTVRATTTTITCSSPVIINQTSPCTTNVSDTSPGKIGRAHV